MLCKAFFILYITFIYTLSDITIKIMNNEDLLAYVIERIKKVRISKGVSQMELCLRANMSQSFLANIENGKKQPSLLTIIRIASALDVNPRDFFPESDKKDKNEIKKEIYELVELL